MVIGLQHKGPPPTIVGGRRLFVTSLGGSPPWRPHRRAQSRRAGVDACVGDSVSELVARGHAWPLPIRWLTHGAVASTSTTTQILHSWSGPCATSHTLSTVSAIDKTESHPPCDNTPPLMVTHLRTSTLVIPAHTRHQRNPL